MRRTRLVLITLAAAALVCLHPEDITVYGTEGAAINDKPHIEMARVRPVDLTTPQFSLGDGQIDLMEGSSLSSSTGVGSRWQTPPYIALHGDPFDERYGAWGLPESTR